MSVHPAPMSIHIVKLPDIGEGVAEAEIAEWLVSEGDLVREDQTLAAVMTDKATVEIPSPVSGRVVERNGEVGAVLAIGSTLVRIELDGTASESPPEAAAPKTNEQPKPAPAEVAAVATISQPKAAPAPNKASAQANRPLASPAVRRQALDAGIDLRLVQGSGPAGRISHADLEQFGTAPQEAPSATAPRRETIEEINVVGLRRRISERMTETNRSIAHFSYIEEVDVTALEALRNDLNERHAPARPKLTVLPFIVRALVVALEEFPQMNALYDDERQVITRHGAVHAGIATQTPAGLLVPVVRHAEAHGLWSTATEIRRLSEAARNGAAARDELSGSTITITSLGTLGGIATTPVINRPEVAIVGVNRIAIRPVWQDGQFVPRKMMNLSSSFDHRVIDGYDAALFIQRIKSLLELPAAMFITD